MRTQITAIFRTPGEAVLVIKGLQALGLSDNRLSLVTRHTPSFGMVDGSIVNAEIVNGEIVNGEPVAETTEVGLLTGAGLGALVGLGAVFLPGVGPFIAAGAIAATIGTMGLGALAGAVVGATSGVIAGGLTAAGYPENDADFYGEEIERGGVLVSVDMNGSHVTAGAVHRLFDLHSGHTAPVMV